MGNPIIRHKFTSDPTAISYNGRVYVYTGHDEAPRHYPGYVLTEWLCFSSDDLINWQEHNVNLKPTDFAWAHKDAYASKMIARNGKFYFYFSTTHSSIDGEAIGVAVSDSPTGPFSDASGSALITSRDLTKGGRNFDPSVLIDDDGQSYLFWGKSTCYYVKLKENMIETDGSIRPVALPDFQEGVHLHKRNDWYYLSFGYDFPEKFAYAMSKSIHGPWDFKGILNEVPGNCETNRGAIVDFNGSSYFFYHNGCLPEGGSHRRSICADRLFYNNDGTIQRVIMTTEGIG
ncbi:glycoside hydrolase family 43 protein [Chryseolinea sp. T2]|uniref:glycoside hydrolase family 43 protein n=1 Tax=Chryseolinea sp. T2 TaxID=3129255 RepID=UPI0030777F8D